MAAIGNYISNISELIEGDILLFRPNYSYSSLGAKVIAAGVRLRNLLSPQGNTDTMHVAICSGFTEDRQPMIAHVTGNSIMGFTEEPLIDMFKRDGGDRACVIFRPQNPLHARNIVEIAKDPGNRDITWAKIPALASFLTQSMLDPFRPKPDKAKDLSKKSYCSKFAVEVVKASEQRSRLKRTDSLNIRSRSAPADLEGALAHHENMYQRLVYPGREIYARMKQCVVNEIARMSAKQTTFAQAKSEQCLQAIQTAERTEGFDGLNELQKTIALLKSVLPVCRQTERGIAEKISTSESYRTILDYARVNGIFEQDFIV